MADEAALAARDAWDSFDEPEKDQVRQAIAKGVDRITAVKGVIVKQKAAAAFEEPDIKADLEPQGLGGQALSALEGLRSGLVAVGGGPENVAGAAASLGADTQETPKEALKHQARAALATAADIASSQMRQPGGGSWMGALFAAPAAFARGQEAAQPEAFHQAAQEEAVKSGERTGNASTAAALGATVGEVLPMLIGAKGLRGRTTTAQPVPGRVASAIKTALRLPEKGEAAPTVTSRGLEALQELVKKPAAAEPPFKMPSAAEREAFIAASKSAPPAPSKSGLEPTRMAERPAPRQVLPVEQAISNVAERQRQAAQAASQAEPIPVDEMDILSEERAAAAEQPSAVAAPYAERPTYNPQNPNLTPLQLRQGGAFNPRETPARLAEEYQRSPAEERPALAALMLEQHGAAALERAGIPSPSSTPALKEHTSTMRKPASEAGAHTPKQELTGTPFREKNPEMAAALERNRLGAAPPGAMPGYAELVETNINNAAQMFAQTPRAGWSDFSMFLQRQFGQPLTQVQEAMRRAEAMTATSKPERD